MNRIFDSDMVFLRVVEGFAQIVERRFEGKKLELIEEISYNSMFRLIRIQWERLPEIL